MVWEIEKKLADDVRAADHRLQRRQHLLGSEGQGPRAAGEQHLQRLALRRRLARQVGADGHGILSRPSLPADGPDAVRDVGADLRACCGWCRATSPTSCSTPRAARPGGEGQDRARARPRPADRRAVRAAGSAACAAAIWAIAYVSEQPAIEEIAPRIPISAKLAGMALFFAVLLGVPLGVISAVRQNTGLDYFLRVVSLSGLSLPSFWLGLLVLMASVHWFGIDPDLRQQPARLLAGRRHARPAGRGGGLPQFGADHAADALVDAGGAAPGLYPHRALQGRLRTTRSTTTTRCATRCCRSSPSSASRRRSWSAA